MLMRYYWKGLRWLATAACGVICATTLAEAPADSPVEPTAEVTEVAEDSDSAQPEVAEKTDATAETNSADPAEAGKADANPEAAKADSQNAETSEADANADSQNADETEANSEFPGAPKLDKALQKRLAMKTAIELDEVIGLVASAIGEGLPPDDEAFAKELLSNSLYQRAEIKLQPILAQINPQDQEIDHTLFAENEDLESALGDLDSVVELNPKMIQAWVRIATLRLAQGGDENHAKAIKAIDTAVENSRNEPLTCVGALLLRSSMREDAESKLADLDEALKVLPNHAPALRTRALVYIEQKDYEKALADLNAAIERDPTHLPTVQARAALLMLMERPAEAIASLDAVIESGDVEDTSPLRFEKAKLLAQEEEYAEAVKVLNRIILENPSALDAYLLRATVYQQMKK
ncbi:MAG: tetratricopeptide repeat protein, partial [Thermoguttaceae bacterium]|nr:tetratricopeptide repeat protein [Thermoguttaceae bacterium]